VQKDRNADSTVHHHIAGGRCTARIDLSFFVLGSAERRQKFGIANLKQLYIGCSFGYTFTHRAIIQPLHKKLIYGTPMCTQSNLAASLIKRAHGANKKLFCEFFGFFPMSKEQRKGEGKRVSPFRSILPHCSEAQWAYVPFPMLWGASICI